MARTTAKRNDVTVIKQALFKSKVWFSLTGISTQVFLIFMTKRRMEERTFGKKKRWVCVNERELIFTYREAQDKYGITEPRFCRAIDMLVDRGFLDIAKPGTGTGKARVATEYALSERWRDYGKEDFQQITRPKVKVGFCRTRELVFPWEIP
jgi:hypothetical protein